jgi:hypothetical protein
MSSSTFADRFKGKSSTLTHTALFSINPELAVTRPQESQIHASSSESPKTITKSAPPHLEECLVLPSIHLSKTPKHNISGAGKVFLFGTDDQSNEGKKTPVLKTRVSNSPTSPLNRSLNRGQFKPYGFKDYIKIKPTKYFKLGGLGPNIGGDEWLKKKYFKEKQLKYGEEVVKNIKEQKDVLDDDSYDLQKFRGSQRFESPWKGKVKKKVSSKFNR